ncbi:PucR family transcriptional regulator, partial [Anoxybacillus sp. LAT_26]|nr:PucR family transcriptional regulator [Anoxybacillus sp. LAT_26]
YMRKNKKEERVQELFWKLLTGHISTEDEIRAHLAAMQITAAPQFAVVVFRFAADLTAEMERQISYLLQTTQQLPL